MIDTTSEDLLTLEEAARRLRTSRHSLWRWARQGLRGIRLDSVRFGRRLYTSEQALDRFGHALNAATTNDGDAIQLPSERRSATEDAAIERALRDRAL